MEWSILSKKLRRRVGSSGQNNFLYWEWVIKKYKKHGLPSLCNLSLTKSDYKVLLK